MNNNNANGNANTPMAPANGNNAIMPPVKTEEPGLTEKPKPKKTPLNVFRFENEWNISCLVCCEDVKLTLCVYFCYICIFCSLQKDMKEHCCAYACIPCPLTVFRTKMRSNLRIIGSIWRDSLMGMFLPWCTLIQMKSELKHRGYAEWP